MEERKKYILIVDDDEEIVTTARAKLERAGFKVEAAYNGEEALKKVGDRTPDLIVLDVVMPKMDGFAFYKTIKEYRELQNIPVIILTARANMRESFLVIGSDDFLAKPFDLDELQKRIEVVLDKKRQQAVSNYRQQRQKAEIIIAGADKALIEKAALDLEREGKAVGIAKTAEETIIRVLQDKPKVIFIDIDISTTPVDEVIKSLRSISAFRTMAIEIYTGKTNKDSATVDKTVRLCRLAGADEYLGVVSEENFAEFIKISLEKKEEM